MVAPYREVTVIQATLLNKGMPCSSTITIGTQAMLTNTQLLCSQTTYSVSQKMLPNNGSCLERPSARPHPTLERSSEPIKTLNCVGSTVDRMSRSCWSF